MRRWWVVGLVVIVGCAKISMTTACPAGSTGVGFALSGSTVGNGLLSMFGSAQTMGLLAAKAGPPAQTTTATMTYDYVTWFGSDAGNLTCINPPTPPTVVSTGPPPQILH